MKLYYQNGFLVQHLYDVPNGMEKTIETCGYNGLCARNSNPLSKCTDQESRKLSHAAEWQKTPDKMFVSLEFISDPGILFQYIQACRVRNIPIRLLFIESDYSEEVWTGPEMPKNFLGYEYNTIPIDNQIITDISWYTPFSVFRKGLNSWGLFPTMDDALLFKSAYDRAMAQGEIGDGEMETHIFCLFEVRIEDVLQVLQTGVKIEPS